MVTLGELSLDFDETTGEVADRDPDESGGLALTNLDGIPSIGQRDECPDGDRQHSRSPIALDLDFDRRPFEVERRGVDRHDHVEDFGPIGIGADPTDHRSDFEDLSLHLRPVRQHDRDRRTASAPTRNGADTNEIHPSGI